MHKKMKSSFSYSTTLKPQFHNSISLPPSFTTTHSRLSQKKKEKKNAKYNHHETTTKEEQLGALFRPQAQVQQRMKLKRRPQQKRLKALKRDAGIAAVKMEIQPRQKLKFLAEEDNKSPPGWPPRKRLKRLDSVLENEDTKRFGRQRKRAKKNIAEAELYNSETFISFSCKISNPLTRSKTGACAFSNPQEYWVIDARWQTGC
jgi:hypothetical protein